MAEEARVGRDTPEPPGELIHLPGPSFLPVLTALGLALAITGVVISLILTVIGVILTLIVVVKWLGETRREISELPLEHH